MVFKTSDEFSSRSRRPRGLNLVTEARVCKPSLGVAPFDSQGVDVQEAGRVSKGPVTRLGKLSQLV